MGRGIQGEPATTTGGADRGERVRDVVFRFRFEVDGDRVCTGFDQKRGA